MQMPDPAEQPTPADASIFSRYPVGSWTLGSGRRTYYFPVESIKEAGSNRVVRRRRPYRNGAKLDDTGSNEKVWTITVCFDNSIDEPGLLNEGGQALYPGVLNDMLASFDVHDTGNLQLSTRGVVRVRAESYERLENYSDRDVATVTFTFVQDNEDSIDATSFKNPTVTATIQQNVQETIFGMEALGGFSQMLADLEETASNLQDAMAAPGEAIQDVDQKAARVERIATNVENQFLVSAQLGRDLLTDPDAWATLRQLRILRDKTARAVTEKSSPIAPVVTAIFSTARSIYDIAAQLGQDPTDLAAINSKIDDLLFIPAGTVVNIFQPTSS